MSWQSRDARQLLLMQSKAVDRQPGRGMAARCPSLSVMRQMHYSTVENAIKLQQACPSCLSPASAVCYCCCVASGLSTRAISVAVQRAIFKRYVALLPLAQSGLVAPLAMTNFDRSAVLGKNEGCWPIC